MSEASATPLPLDGGSDMDTTPGGQKEVRWVEIAQMPGLAPAQILAGRLQSEGIPAYAWQEGAGQATGLVVGLLGAGRVMVPEEFEERALEILSEEFDSDEEE